MPKSPCMFSGHRKKDSSPSHIPTSLQKTVDQIKAAFQYQSYRLLETIVARSRADEQTYISGTLQPFKDNPDVSQPATYSLRFRLAAITTSSGGDLFRIQRFQFEAGFPIAVGTLPTGEKAKVSYATTQWQRSPATIQTNFDISSNQQVVIGKAGVAGNSAVFLIVEAKAVK